jgi:peptidoglycan/xylan/chitin deacetylase (PgdA/CDA1 family)
VPRRPLLGWADLQALAREGASVGAHSATHRVLTDLTPADQEREISGAKDDIEQHIGRAVDLFAYPYGRTSATVEARVRSHYRAGVGTRLDFARPGASLAALDRIDAYYLSPASARVLDSARLAAYLAARRIGRRLRALGR